MASWLLDSNVLLRVMDRNAPDHLLARRSVAILWSRGDTLCVTLQCLAEFWSVCTRPATARGGLSLSIAETHRRLRVLERHLTFLPDTARVRDEWRQLVLAHQVQGVQVHDARLVGAMLAHNLSHLLTFNSGNFHRYPNVVTAHPQDILSGKV